MECEGVCKRRGKESPHLLVLGYASAIFGPSSISGAPRCMSSGMINLLKIMNICLEIRNLRGRNYSRNQFPLVLKVGMRAMTALFRYDVPGNGYIYLVHLSNQKDLIMSIIS